MEVFCYIYLVDIEMPQPANLRYPRDDLAPVGLELLSGMNVQRAFPPQPVWTVLLGVAIQSFCAVLRECGVCGGGVDDLPGPDEGVVLCVADCAGLVGVDGGFDVCSFGLEFGACEGFVEIFDS